MDWRHILIVSFIVVLLFVPLLIFGSPYKRVVVVSDVVIDYFMMNCYEQGINYPVTVKLINFGESSIFDEGDFRVKYPDFVFSFRNMPANPFRCDFDGVVLLSVNNDIVECVFNSQVDCAVYDCDDYQKALSSRLLSCIGGVV